MIARLLLLTSVLVGFLSRLPGTEGLLKKKTPIAERCLALKYQKGIWKPSKWSGRFEAENEKLWLVANTQRTSGKRLTFVVTRTLEDSGTKWLLNRIAPPLNKWNCVQGSAYISTTHPKVGFRLCGGPNVVLEQKWKKLKLKRYRRQAVFRSSTKGLFSTEIGAGGFPAIRIAIRETSPKTECLWAAGTTDRNSKSEPKVPSAAAATKDMASAGGGEEEEYEFDDEYEDDDEYKDEDEFEGEEEYD